jgi:microcystin-dependent protein
MASTLRSFANTNARLKPTIGDTKTSAVNDDHLGWLLCDGRVLNTSDYAHLFSVLSNSFGGDGVTTFALPRANGRVPGFIGQAEVPDVSSNTWILGDISGEETHDLLLSEVPAHNHNDISGSPGVTSTAPGVTSAYTHNHGGFTGVSGEHNHGITDPSHSHSYVNQPNSHEVAVSATTTGTADDVNVGQTTGASSTGITINSAGAHSHTIASDTHTHTIASNGGNQRHNNIQPTIWIGNLFIYGGRPWVATPYARALNGANPVAGSNNYPPQGPPLNIY